MYLDPRTIIITTIIGTLLMSISLFFISRGHLGQIRGVTKWASATLIQSFGWIVMGALRGILPDLISIILGNALLLLAIVFYFIIIAEFKNKKAPTLWAYSLVGLEAVVLAYFVVVTPNVAARFAVISGCTALVMFASSYLLFSERSDRPLSHTLTGSMFAICGLLLTVRCLNSLFWNTNPNQLAFDPHPMQSMAYLTFYITSVMLTFGFVLMCNDKYISERNQMEEALTESQKQINAIFKNAPDGVIVVDDAGLFREWNQMAEFIFGWKKEEVIGKPFFENLFSLQFRETYNKEIKQFFKTGERQIIGKPIELPMLRKNNAVFEASMNVSSTQINGKYFFISFITDISERKLKEFEKHLADTKLRVLSKAVEQSPATTVITDLAGNIEFVNPKFTETTGYALEEVIGKNFRILKTDHKSRSEYEELWNTILSGKNWSGIFLNKKKNGELYWESAVISPVKDTNGIITNFMAVKEDITERKKAEETLRVSELRYRTLAETIDDMIYIISPKGTVEYLNNHAALQFGQPVEAIIGKQMDDLFPPNEKERRWEVFQKVFKSGNSDYNENLTILGGQKKWLATNLIALRDVSGNITSVMGVSRDITERKKTDTLLKKKTVQLKEAQKLAKIGSWEWDLLENKATRSDEHYRIYGLTRQEPETTYENFRMYTHPDDRKYVDTIFERAFKDCQPFSFFHRIIRQDGAVRILQAKGNVITDAKGKAIRVFGTRQDLTEVKTTEQELLQNIAERHVAEANLRYKTEQLKVAQHLSHIGSWEHDVLANKTTWSAEMYRIFGLSPQEYEPSFENLLKNTHPDDREMLIKIVQQARKDHQPYHFSHRIIRPDSTVRILDAIGNVFADNNGNAIRMFGTDQDITELKLAEQELIRLKEKAESSEKIKDRFLANMSHEIRTPMNAIMGFTQLLRDSKLSAEQKLWLRTIKNSGENLLVIINDILDFSKMEADKIEFEENRIDIANIIKSTIVALRSDANKKKINVLFSIDKQIPSIVLGDAVRLNQIILNLVSNALKFTFNGRVDVTVNLVDETDKNIVAEFSVTDTGIGIEEDNLKNIFESFTQVSGSFSRKYEGTGLGLTIAKKLVELQGGSLTVKSEYKKGSCFSFTMPFKKAETYAKITKTKRKNNGIEIEKVANLNILLVEDNISNQQLTKAILSKWKINMDIADNGKIAISKLNSKNYDLILMDIQMPEMDGYETSEYIRSVLLNYTPIIAMTAHAMRDEAENCIRHGMNDYISKPFDPNELLAKIIHHSKGISGVLAPPKEITLLNFDYLKEIAEGDIKLMVEMITIFVKNTPPQLELLENAMKANAWVELIAVAHKLKSNVGVMGLDDCVPILKTIEDNAVKKIKLKTLPELVNTVIQRCNEALELLKIEIVKLSKS